MPPILSGHPDFVIEKYIQLGGNPWSSDDLVTRETLQMSIIACLTNDGFKLSLDISMDATSRVFFFIRDTESITALIPDMAKLGVGDYSTPTVIRYMSSFFRNYKGRTTPMRSHTSLSWQSWPGGNRLVLIYLVIKKKMTWIHNFVNDLEKLFNHMQILVVDFMYKLF